MPNDVFLVFIASAEVPIFTSIWDSAKIRTVALVESSIRTTSQSTRRHTRSTQTRHIGCAPIGFFDPQPRIPITLIMRPACPWDARCEKNRSVWQLVHPPVVLIAD